MKTLTLPLGENPAVSLTAYLHDPSPEMPDMAVRPAMLVIPGGGYFMCSDREAEPIALAYLAKGYQAFVLRYTTGKEHTFEEALCDAQAALNTILAHAKDWGCDPGRIAAIGFSAGGHLAAALATMGNPKPAAVLLGYACILEAIGETLAFPIPDAAAAVDKTTPPTFLFATADDRRVPIANTLAFADALARHDVPFAVHVFQHGAHGLSLATAQTCSGSAERINPDFAQWFSLSVGFLQQVFGQTAAQ